MFGNNLPKIKDASRVVFKGAIKAAQFTEDEGEFYSLLRLVTDSGAYASVRYGADRKVLSIGISREYSSAFIEQKMGPNYWFVAFENSLGIDSWQILSPSQFEKQFKEGK